MTVHGLIVRAGKPVSSLRAVHVSFGLINGRLRAALKLFKMCSGYPFTNGCDHEYKPTHGDIAVMQAGPAVVRFVYTEKGLIVEPE